MEKGDDLFEKIIPFARKDFQEPRNSQSQRPVAWSRPEPGTYRTQVLSIILTPIFSALERRGRGNPITVPSKNKKCHLLNVKLTSP
jgi:hypothetical protein